MTTSAFVSVVAPLRDDEDIVKGFIDETLAVLRAEYEHYELILVDDGSQDGTPPIVRELLSEQSGLRYLRLSRSFGQETAIAAGLDSAIGDYVAVMLPASDPPDLLPELVRASRGGPGIVYGVRTNRRGDGPLARLGSWFFFRVLSPWMNLGVPHDATHLRVLDRQAVDAVSRIRARNRYLRTLTEQVGFASQPFPYNPIERRSQPRRKSLAEATGLAVDIIVSNTTRPLRILSGVAALASALAFAYAVYVLVVFLVYRDVAEGWVSLSGPIAVLFCILFAILAVLTEYVGQLFEEVKARPLYHVEVEESGSFSLHEERLNVVTDGGEG